MNVSTSPPNRFFLQPPQLLFPPRTFHLYSPPRFKPRHVSLCSPNPHLPLPFDFLAPALGFLSVFLSRFYSRAPDIGHWILFTSPTPFNRFVLLRCPSLSFTEIEDANEKLVEEERHFVRFNSGRIERVRVNRESVEYQRVCVNTTDGGVVSIDWPAKLELKEEYGFDTTLLLVPGTTEGSYEESVRDFVSEALRRGFFPVVMNPRGCAASPLTTPRLFTAADSDDISTVIQFISKARPWTTLMAVGWGYGANMLTKYLAEAGETTRLTAATCINNPFDLEEATRIAPHHNALDQKLAGGLVDILRSNKELFQGRGRGFDVEKALLAKSVRDFEKSISMVSYGFEDIKDFYSKSSSRSVVGNVKIPVLYIQHDDGTVPLFSIPRSMIEENAFTSLILCSSTSSSVILNDRDTASWCQNLALEWLAAVELGLLKGRHPLLRDVDVTINPSKGFALLEDQADDDGANNLLDLTLTDANEYTIMARDMVDRRNAAIDLQTRSRLGLNGHLELGDGEQVKTGAVQHVDSTKKQLVEAEEDSSEDTERGQVLQTTQVVMNILDATMPGTLSEDERNKVLTAVGQGETLMKALQDSVPDDVRGKLMNAVSGILRAQNMGSKFEELLGIGKNLNASIGPKSSTKEKARIASGAGDSPKDHHSSDQSNLGNDNFDRDRSQTDKSDSGIKSKLQPTEDSHKSTDLGHTEINNQHGDSYASNRKGTHDSENNHESDGSIREKAALHFDNCEKGEETNVKHNSTSNMESAGRSDEPTNDEHKVELNDGASQPETRRDADTQKNEEKTVDSSIDKNKSPSSTEEAHQPVGTSSEPLPMESNDDQRKENKTMQPVLDQNSSTDSGPPAFNVTQALDALTGMDDSTQVAVNSVFGVIEDMLTHLEEEKEDEDKSDTMNQLNDSLSKKQQITGDHPFKQEKTDEKKNLHLDAVKPSEDPNLSSENIIDTRGNADSDYLRKEGEARNHSADGDHLAEYAEKHENFPLSINPNLHKDYLWNDHFHNYLIAKMPHSKPLDVDATTALLLDYIPEDGQWELLEQPGNDGESTVDFTVLKGIRSNQVDSRKKLNNTINYIEPAYIVLDTDTKHEPVGEYNTAENLDETVDDRLRELMQFVKIVILDSLRVEVGRKLSAADMKKIKSDIAGDLEVVANAVSLAVGRNRDDTWSLKDKGYSIGSASEKIGNLNGEHIIKAISSAVQGTSHLRRVLPIGVIVGSSLAALRKYFDVVPRRNGTVSSLDNKSNAALKDLDLKPPIPADQMVSLKNIEEKGKIDVESLHNDNVMVGAFTAALGASTLFVQQQDPNQSEGFAESTSKSFKQRSNHEKAAEKLDDAEKSQNDIVSSLAEKAMSVAGPVVPTKEDGEVDQERLVMMLTDLGQKGGMLRFVGKLALLWGGIRGAMSLTDRLISFLRIAERPLHQRVIGFAGMVLVLWSPVVVPLLPATVQCWTTNTPSRFVEIVSIIGLYAAVMMLVVLWGRRIREYEDPLEDYGLDLISLPKMQSFLKGMIGGVMLVLSIQTVNILLGCASFCWPTHFASFTLDSMENITAYAQMILIAVQGIVTATGIVLVEELVFRSWLPEEISADLGYDQGIIISGLAFSLFQRSFLAIPGLWLLSLALAGFRQRGEGSLSIPIGLRAGIMVSSYVLHRGGFLRYNSNFPVWLTGTHPFQPFSGMVGLCFSLILAIIFYPRQPLRKRRKRGE